jgi:6-phosphogluconolactonase
LPTTFLRVAAFGLPVMLAVSCGGNPTSKVMPSSSCVDSSKPSFAYAWNGLSADTVSVFTVNSCTGDLVPTTPATVTTGINSESLVVDPLGRFVSVANLVFNAADQATISMYTIHSSTGNLTLTNPPTVPTGFFPQGIGIDPSGKFVYTANSNDNTVSMFTINPSTGILTPTTPDSVATGWRPLSVTVHPSGKFAYAANQDDDTVSMYSINAATGVMNMAPRSRYTPL